MKPTDDKPMTVDALEAIAREVGQVERRHCIGRAQGFDIRDGYAELCAAIEQYGREQYARGVNDAWPAGRGSGEPVALTFNAFRAANVARCLKWHPEGIDSWSPSDWMTAVVGETGELASLLKMRNRERDGLPGNKFSPTQKQIADELADVLTYLDLLAEVLGVDLGAAAVLKFNEVSERVGFPDRITLAAPQPREPLTEEQIMDLLAEWFVNPRWPSTAIDCARAIERAHNIRSASSDAVHRSRNEQACRPE